MADCVSLDTARYRVQRYEDFWNYRTLNKIKLRKNLEVGTKDHGVGSLRGKASKEPTFYLCMLESEQV